MISKEVAYVIFLFSAKFQDSEGKPRINILRAVPKYVDLYGVAGLLIFAVFVYVARKIYKCMPSITE